MQSIVVSSGVIRTDITMLAIVMQRLVDISEASAPARRVVARSRP
jgi:hypothetical protein